MQNTSSPWGQQTQYFYDLTPDKILDAVESVLDVRCTGRNIAHNSMENRVYELEIELDHEPEHRYDKARIAKFYRPGRWNKEQISEEHQFIQKLQDADIPVIAPLVLNNETTLAQLEDNKLFYCLYPKVGGRAPYELSKEQIAIVGRLLARMHQVGHEMQAKHRIHLTPESYGEKNLEQLLLLNCIPESCSKQYEDTVLRICSQTTPLFKEHESILVHGDCHLGNLLWGEQGPSILDFDDSVVAPPIQDLWLMILGRGPEYKDKLDVLIRNYELMRPFDWDSLRLIEPLRALRMIHFNGWIAKRIKDPAFQRAFPQFGSENYWLQQIQDLQEQEKFLHRSDIW